MGESSASFANMSDAEMQEEELEVLKSIYEGDPMYSSGEPTSHCYKMGEHGESKSFILEIKWSPTYPSDTPEVKLASFYNNHLTTDVKESIVKAVEGEAVEMVGMSMTYTLFEWAKENLDTLLEAQPESLVVEAMERVQVKEKKEQLTKGQKRNAWRKGGLNEEDRQRGWNWVDVIKHLHQTGGTADAE